MKGSQMQITKDTAAIVTGGASGLGLATARALAAAGARVTIFDLNQEAGEAIAAEIGGAFAKVNVLSDDDVEAGFAKARASHGIERILVNCAGGGRGGKTVSRNRETKEIRRHAIADFEWTLQLNLVGTFRCITASAAEIGRAHV